MWGFSTLRASDAISLSSWESSSGDVGHAIATYERLPVSETSLSDLITEWEEIDKEFKCVEVKKLGSKKLRGV